MDGLITRKSTSNPKLDFELLSTLGSFYTIKHRKDKRIGPVLVVKQNGDKYDVKFQHSLFYELDYTELDFDTALALIVGAIRGNSYTVK